MIGAKKNSLLLSVSLSLLLLSGCGIDNTDENIVGENLLVDAETFKPEVNLTKEQIQAGLDAEGNGQTALLGIKSYKISYMTTDENGKSVRASGLVSIPAISEAFMQGYKAKTGTDFSLSIVSDQHGTIFTNTEAPSVAASTTDMPNSLATAFSSIALFMTVQPDYLGFGDSNTTHPYILEKPSADTTVDMIKAAISFANQAGLPINGQVFLSGYSEGGYATMAAAKEIQANHPDIHLMAVAPMAGPYDVEKLGIGTLSADMMAFPPFLADIAYSYATAYDDVSLDTILNAPYAAMVPTLFDGEHDGTEIYKALPNAYDDEGPLTDRLFIPTFSDDLISNPDNLLRKHFRENSVIDWTPTMPMKLYHCGNDTVVPFSMTTLAQESFTESGSTSTSVVRIDTIPDSQNPLDVHRDCAAVAYAQAIPWFDKIRKGEK